MAIEEVVEKILKEGGELRWRWSHTRHSGRLKRRYTVVKLPYGTILNCCPCKLTGVMVSYGDITGFEAVVDDSKFDDNNLAEVFVYEDGEIRHRKCGRTIGRIILTEGKKMRVSFQGELGAYSEQAVYKFFGKEIEVMPCETFSELFERVSDGAANFGVAPVENSTAGTITQTHDLLLEHDIHIVGEIKFRIVHCLISFPQTRLEDIKEIYTHPQAWAQCQTFCRQFPYWKYIPAYDTAGSVKIIRDENLQDAAAIASSRAAEIYEMKILQEGIENNHNNTTRFFVVSQETAHAPLNNRISLVFATRHHAGALYDCLGEFASRGINLTKIESRPRPNRPWEYVFYLDLDGSINNEVCTQAITGLLKRAAFVKILGSYRAAED